MTTVSQFRKAALSNSDVVESAVDGAPVFAVDGKEFALLDADARVCLRLPGAEAEDMVSQHATAERAGDFVRLPVKDINGQALNYWVRRAWLACAPPEVAARASTADKAGAGEVGDLPKAIGRPATRALANVGITTLDQVAGLSDAELNALHGVGPKAVRILRETLESR
ncbi:hypothetical protein [Nonomuraea sp. C10]|uniref:hypothetical protein n=1 Tax=Nonomuraea sp. C10 TaxID=2600577 RepID=UPI0011CD5421|nr:hypothetical protein [Nonomuraea sp. C10]TXK35976.1 hypothetical protein FR742_43235 [Nonomuraea sp. C10]